VKTGIQKNGTGEDLPQFIEKIPTIHPFHYSIHHSPFLVLSITPSQLSNELE